MVQKILEFFLAKSLALLYNSNLSVLWDRKVFCLIKTHPIGGDNARTQFSDRRPHDDGFGEKNESYPNVGTRRNCPRERW